MAKVSVFDNNYFKKFYAAYLVGGAAGAAKFISTKTKNFDKDEYKDAITFIRDDFAPRIEKFCNEENYDELVKSIFASLCDNYYDEAIVMLDEQLSTNKFKNTFKNHLGFFINRTLETKRNENNTEDVSKIVDDKTLMQETLTDSKTGKTYSAFLKLYLPDKYISSFNRYDELSKIELDDINTVFHPLDKYTDAGGLKNYFNLLKHKGINTLISEVTKILDVYATGERINVLNVAFGQVFDYNMTNEMRKEIKKEIEENDLLSKLTRGELQKFILEGDMCAETKLLLLESSRIDLFKENGEEEKLEENIPLYELYRDYVLSYLNIESLITDRKDLCDDYDLTDDEKMLAGLKLHRYERINLLKILEEESKPLKMKWLQEAYSVQDAQDVDYFSSYDDFNEMPIYYYRKFIDQVVREFYDEKGIDYYEIKINDRIPRNISYGIEIEEIGLTGDNKYAMPNYFESKYDASLSYYSKSKGHVSLSSVTKIPNGEYVSDLKQTNKEDYLFDLESIMDEVDLLNFFGAKINGTCGFHVHLSSDYTENAEDKDLVKIFGMPEDYDSEDYPDSSLKTEYEERKDDEGFLVPERIAKEIYEMQSVLNNKFMIHDNRARSKGHAAFLKSEKASFSDKSQFVNFLSLETCKGIEFRFFNLPDNLDRKVVEAYIDFATSYFAYLEEGNNTLEYATEAYNDVTGLELKDLSMKEYEDYMFDILLGQLDLKEDTLKVFENLDEIFELYNTVDYSVDPRFDYYTKYDMKIEDEEINHDIAANCELEL